MRDRDDDAENHSPFLRNLNPQQKKAVLHRGGPAVVFAGAGSGKTRVIVNRIAHLLSTGVPPHSILALTFTNKAAKEMGERLTKLVNMPGRIQLGTFHAVCARWLRQFAPELGFTSEFSIYDDNDSLQALKTILKGFNVDLKQNTPQQYQWTIDRAKAYGWLPIDLTTTKREHADFFPPFGVDVYKRYQEYLASCNAMDFSDLLMNVLLLLRNNDRVKSILSSRYQHILVDEYQDTNITQLTLLSLLTGPDCELFVVGDDDQAIYSWRGADPTNILNFKEHFPRAIEIKLGQNYRCSGRIVSAAQHLIAHNKTRSVKNLWTDNPEGSLIEYIQEYDGETEAWRIAEKIEQERDQYSLNDMAIFYRTNAQSRQIEEVLRRKKISHKIYGSLKFYERAEIKDLVSYFKLTVNPNDDLSLKRILNVPTRGLAKKAQQTIEQLALAKHISFYQACHELIEGDSLRGSKNLREFCQLLAKIKEQINKNPLDQALSQLLSLIDYKSYLEKKFPTLFTDKIANVHELGSALAEYAVANPEATLSTWLNDVALINPEESEAAETVSVMTLHAAKGLEFKRVFIAGVEDGLIPHSNNIASDLEEERRLFYVGITRTSEKLTLLGAQKRRVFNQWMANEPSRFLAEIPKELFLGYSQDSHLDEVSENASGQGVYHPTYGYGVLEKIENDFGTPKAIVMFRDFGLRKVKLDHLEERQGSPDFDI